MGTGQADNKRKGTGSDKRYTYTGSHRRAGRGGLLEVRRTGDRVHCAAASATDGGVALPRKRGEGIRKDPPPWHQRQRKRATPTWTPLSVRSAGALLAALRSDM